MAFLMDEDVDIVNEIDEIADNSADVVQKLHQKTVPNSWIDDLIDRANRLKYEMEAENLISAIAEIRGIESTLYHISGLTTQTMVDAVHNSSIEELNNPDHTDCEPMKQIGPGLYL